jgi:hypothetical protein
MKKRSRSPEVESLDIGPFRSKLDRLHNLIKKQDWKEVDRFTTKWKPTFLSELQSVDEKERCSETIREALEFKQHPQWMSLAKDANLMFRLDSLQQTWHDFCAGKTEQEQKKKKQKREEKYIACKRCNFYRALLNQANLNVTSEEPKLAKETTESPEEHELYFSLTTPSHLKMLVPSIISRFAPKLSVCLHEVVMDIYKVDELALSAHKRKDQRALDIAMKLPQSDVDIPEPEIAVACFRNHDISIWELDVQVWDEWSTTHPHELKIPQPHSNVILINRIRREIELFDPHGRYGFDDQPRVTIRILESFLQALRQHGVSEEDLAHYAKLTPWKLCRKPFAWQQTYDLCSYYSLIYMFLRILCPEWSREDLLTCIFQNPQQEKELLNAFHALIKTLIKKSAS